MAMAYVTIGEFSRRSRLSPKALRIYDELGLVVPAKVDAETGYRLYDEGQVERARLVGLLRRMEMPLSEIARVLSLEPEAATRALDEWWARETAALRDRGALVGYVRKRLGGGDRTMYDIQVRSIPERTVASMSRHVDRAAVDGFVAEAFKRLHGAGDWIEGIAGAPYLVFYGEVSADSDGPVEVCRPIASLRGRDGAVTEFECRVEPQHDEVYVRLALKDLGWPAVLPVCDALERWVRENGRDPMGALREVFIADVRKAAPDALVCDLAVPLR
jgi:DNA-binding transcriptional MerR regulator